MPAVRALSSSAAFTALVTVFVPLALLAGAAANIAAGGCIPFWTVAWALVALVRPSTPLISLYGDARTALQSMLAESLRLPEPPECRAAELREHVGLLSALGTADNLRATFVGIAVTWGLAKTVFVTAAKLAVALWSVLRGAGVSFTIETACPGY
ncbi:hypothetical protein DFJ74DRAFT_711796 [Hyaloraphidium curvatum]|nr:hypothetical protein DFJ74DRAFT_711796 [Hyaloraphidium curvatum]